MQFITILLTLFTGSVVQALTCGWDPRMLKADCSDLLTLFQGSTVRELGDYDFWNCHVRFSKANVKVPRQVYIRGLTECLARCAKFDHIYCLYPSVPTTDGQTVDMVLGTHF